MRRGVKAVILTVVFGLIAAQAFGREWRITPSAELKQEYNDNIYFAINDIKSDYITTLSPKLELARKTERMDFSLSGKADGRGYLRNDELNALDQTYHGSIRYQLNPKMSLTAKGAYIQDSTPDRDLMTTGFALSTTRRFRQNYSFAGDYLFTEKTMATLSYDYSKDDWSSRNLVGYESNGVNLGFAHNLSSIISSTTGRVNFGYTRYITSTSAVENYTGTIGFKRDLSEKWSMLVDVGARYTKSDFDMATYQFVPPFFVTIVTTKMSNKGWGMMGQAVLSYKGELTNVDFTFNRDVMASSGLYGTSERNALGFNISRKLSYEFSVNLSGSYFLNQSDAGKYSPYQINRETFSIIPGIRYQFTKDTAIDATYNFTKTKYSDAVTGEAHRNLFLIRLSIQHDLLK